MGKIINLEELIGIRQKLKSESKTLVTTSGCFDILHPAHFRYLEKSKALGDILTVFLNDDSSVKKNKGEDRPINHEQDRAYSLSQIISVDYVTLFSEKDAIEIIRAIRPDVHTKGGSYDQRIEDERKFVESYGGKYITFPLEEGYSTTKIIEALGLSQ